MKIGFVVDDTLDKPDGVQQYVLSLGEWMRTQGHEVHYLVGASERSDVSNIHSIARTVPVRFNGNRLSIPLPASRRAIRKLLNELQLDVIHVQMPYSPLMAAKVISEAAVMRTAILGTFHILPFSTIERHATHLLGLWLRNNLKHFIQVFAVSSAAQIFAKEAFAVDTTVLPNVIDVDAYRNAARKAPPEKLTITFLGRLVRRKGAMELLQAIAALPDAVKDTVEVRIGGKGPLLSELQEYVRLHNLEKTVRFDGFISETDKPQYLRNATIAIFPSLGGESFGIVLIEAMAAGAQVVMGGNNAGYSTVIGEWDNATFDPRDTASFTRKLTAMISDSNLRQRIHEEQQRAIEAYDINRVGEALTTAYAAALHKKQNLQ